MTKRDLFRLAAAACAIAAAAPASSQAPASAQPAAPASAALPDADPAMWLVEDEDTKIYLFGSFHVLDGKADWFNDEVRTAFDKSDEVVLEAIMPDDPAAMAPLLQKYAIDATGKPLSAKLSATGQAKLTKLLAGMGAPAAAFDRFKPMFASMTLVMLPYQALGMTGDKGAEAKLTAAAKAAGKPIGELEGFEAQLKMLDQIPEKAQIAGLEELIADYDKAPDFIRKMVVYWNSGDAESFAKLMTEMQTSSPDVYKVLMADRNKRWAEWVDQRLDKPGTVFVAVGTAHLAGTDSLQKFLAGRGIKSKRAS